MSLKVSLQDLIKQLKQHNLVKTGDFVLKSGIRSNLYFDFKGLINHPKLVNALCEELSQLITNQSAVCVAGVPLGGIPYATMVSHITNLPQVLIREEPKTYGLQQQIEGYVSGTKIILVEDVITTGQSVINTINILKANHIDIAQIICILDRAQGGVDKIIELGYDVSCLYKASDFTGTLKSIEPFDYKMIDLWDVYSMPVYFQNKIKEGAKL